MGSISIIKLKINLEQAPHSLEIRKVEIVLQNRPPFPIEPEQGHLDFDDVFQGLGKAGFDGWASIEIFPKPDPDTAAKQAAEFILPRLKMQ